MNKPLIWERDGQNWPNRDFSRFIEAGGITWHIQEMGETTKPLLLLIHGTGASTHSWRDIMPLLATQYRVMACDLPGHGFTQKPENSGLTLSGMAAGIGALLKVLDAQPEAIIGHSAGGAIAIRLALDGLAKPRLLIGLNAALKPYGGVAAGLFPALAKMLVMNPFVPRFFAWQAGEARAVARLIEGTGSRLDETGLGFYQRLFSSRVHVASTLAMMAQWDLLALQKDFSTLSMPLHLIVALNDKAVSPEEAREMKAKHPAITLHFVKGLGHLSHEEKPSETAALIENILSEMEQTGVVR